MTAPLIWLRLPDAEAVAQEARLRILGAAQRAIAARGSFSLVLAGGRTPERVYRLLADETPAWERWQLYLGDERCLAPEHPERNSRMAMATLGARVPPKQFHPIPAELGPQAAALAYSALIADALPFDLVLLGLGEDGHTASLFPGHDHPEEHLAVAVTAAPKPPPERVSLNYGTLGRCREMLFLVTGEGKQEAVARWRQGEPIPAARISPSGVGRVLCDRSAWPE